MSNFKKLMMTAAGGDVLNVEDVFSTYLYKGNGSTQTISNGIDLDGEGGLVWIKCRNTVGSHILQNSERVNKWLRTELTNGELDFGSSAHTFNTNGFTLNAGNQNTNATNLTYASWTFRKAPKFFDVVSYTGTGSAQNISHSLGSVPGCIIIKCASTTTDWAVYHRGLDATAPEDYYIRLNSNNTRTSSNSQWWNNTAPTASQFTVGTHSNFNSSGETYVAYLFAHNDGDGGFGPNNQDIIKCGSYTGNTSSDGPVIDLGFEPDFVLVKNITYSYDWYMFDQMRGMTAKGLTDLYLRPNVYNNEDGSQDYISVRPDGFQVHGTGGHTNTSGTYIYIAIRRGPMALPENGNEVFWMSNLDGTEPTYNSNNFPVDMAIHRHVTAGVNWHLVDRLRAVKSGDERYLETDTNQIDQTSGAYLNGEMDYMNGWASTGSNTLYQSWMWRRAPSYFDIVSWTGTSSSTQTLEHNLGTVPEMIWFKNRDDYDGWFVYHTATGNAKCLVLNSATSQIAQTTYLNSTTPTDTTFTVGNVLNWSSSFKYIAYLFASVNGVSKVGSFTGNGTSQTIDCGFSSGARFVLIKGLTTGSQWELWDTKRGISSGNDSRLNLNNANGAVTTDDSLDPHSSGFIVNQVSATNVNLSGETYIFYAIA
jgi:hypothetical protein